MGTKNLFLLLASFSFCTAYSQTYITNVTVVDVVTKKLIPAQTVVVTGKTISAVKPVAEIKIPSAATVIDGNGKYLIPGLTDAHVHFFQSGGLYTRPDAHHDFFGSGGSAAKPDAFDINNYMPYEKEIAWVHSNMEDFLKRYLQAGITTVIDVGATYNFLKLRDSFAGKNYSPTIYMTGPLLTSYEPVDYKNLNNDQPFKLFTTVDDAKKLVQEQLPFHPDFIKIWYIVNSDTSAKKYQPIVKTVIEEAHKNNLKVAIHATEAYTAQLAVESGCDFLVHSVEDKIISTEFVKLLKSKNVVLCPTLIVADGYYNTFGQKSDFSFYELTRSNPQQIGSLNDFKHLPDSANIERLRQRINSPNYMNRIVRRDSIRAANLKKLADAGVTIVAGTDAGNIGTPHATSFLRELKAMQKSGLTNWQLLQSATINSAKILSKENSTGSVSVGKQADLVLLTANPIENIENLTKINLVFNKGTLIKPDTLIKETPLALVQRQLTAYNLGNIDAFLEPYSDDVEVYLFPDKVLYKGKESMREDYDKLFKKFPNLHCEITERIIQGNTIIDNERISGVKTTKFSGTAIYQIENDKIKKVYFIQ